MIWLCFDAFFDGFDIWTRMMEEEKMLADFFSVNDVKKAWVLGFREKNII